MSTSLLRRSEGTIAFTDTGSGPLVVAVPGMGDLRSTYDDIVPALVDAGYRVVVTDLRGHGDSDTTFGTHGDDATGADLLALVEHLDAGPAVLLGNSMGASAATWAAAERPDLVRGLVLISPLLRETVSPATQRLLRVLYRVLFAGPWGAAAWASYYSSISKGRRSPRHAEHVAAVRQAMREPGHLRSFRQLAVALDHSVVEARLGEVSAPALVVVGELDPDYGDPAAELDRMTGALSPAVATGTSASSTPETAGTPGASGMTRATGLLVPDAGHYPQHQAPDVVVPAVLGFLAGLRDGAAHPARDGHRA